MNWKFCLSNLYFHCLFYIESYPSAISLLKYSLLDGEITNVTDLYTQATFLFVCFFPAVIFSLFFLNQKPCITLDEIPLLDSVKYNWDGCVYEAHNRHKLYVKPVLTHGVCADFLSQEQKGKDCNFFSQWPLFGWNFFSPCNSNVDWSIISHEICFKLENRQLLL